MPKTRVTRDDRRNLRLMFRSALWHERGIGTVDATAPQSQQVEQAVIGERLRLSGRTSRDVLYTWVEEVSGQRPQSDDVCIRSALSSGDYAAIFTDAIGASVARGYNESLSSITGWTSREILSQQKVERVRLSVPPHLQPVPRGGQADTGGDQFAVAEEYRLGTFGHYQAIDEQDLLGDVLGVLTTIPQQYGAAAARLVVDLAFTELLANPQLADGNALFSAENENLFSGALSGDKLDEGIEKMLGQSEAGVPLDLQPRYLLVPPQLAGTARKLARERKLDDDADLIVLSSNRLTGVRDPSTGETVNGSETSWYLASGEENAAIEIGLFDSDTPAVGTGRLDQGQWGIWYDVRMRAAAAAVRPRSILRYDV